MQREAIEVGSFQHVFNRGTDKRDIFLDAADHKRFLLYLQVLNNVEIASPHNIELLEKLGSLEGSKVPLVDIVAFCLMPNHFHLLLYENREGGISKFMQRMGTAYTMHFNEKYERSGALFQGVFKSRPVHDMRYLQKVIDYVHLNPRKLSPLDKYVWSSFPDYCGRPLHRKILNLDPITESLPEADGYASWLKQQNDFEEIVDLLID